MDLDPDAIFSTLEEQGDGSTSVQNSVRDEFAHGQQRIVGEVGELPSRQCMMSERPCDRQIVARGWHLEYLSVGLIPHEAICIA
jgi:hypothetical protein